jgi:ubiquinone/menaquinone biosynthesis C-methylase UbiE
MTAAQERPAPTQYENSRNLRDRGYLHARYANRNWFGWVAGHLNLPPAAEVIVIGCGAGWFWQSAAPHMPEGVHLTLVDRSAGMLLEAVEALSANGSFGVRADAMALPFLDKSFDAAIAMHMLYHAPEPEQALDEIVRVLRPGGVAAVTTNGDDNLRELFVIGAEVFGCASRDPATQAFSVTTAHKLLTHRFDTVTLHRFEDTYAVNDAEDIVRYLTSFPLGITAEQREQLRYVVAERIHQNGGVLKLKREAALICGH